MVFIACEINYVVYTNHTVNTLLIVLMHTIHNMAMPKGNERATYLIPVIFSKLQFHKQPT